MRYPNLIFLVGLPGSGKSSFGSFLAEKIGYDFIDLDDVIQIRKGQSISEMFSELGESQFREIERDALRDMDGKKAVVATGGGAPCFHENMTWMNEHGFTIYLNPVLDEIIIRISKEDHRPLLKQNPADTLKLLHETRSFVYSQAAFRSSSTDQNELLKEFLITIAGRVKN